MSSLKSHLLDSIYAFFPPRGIKLKQKVRVVTAGRRFFFGRVSRCGVLDLSPARVSSCTWGSDDANNSLRETHLIDSLPCDFTRKRCSCHRAIGSLQEHLAEKVTEDDLPGA